MSARICSTPDCGARVVNENPAAKRCPICAQAKRVADGKECGECGRNIMGVGRCWHCAGDDLDDARNFSAITRREHGPSAY